MLQKNIGFLGAGQMARALAGGLVRGDLLSPERIVAFDIAADALDRLCAAVPGIRTVSEAPLLAASSDVIVLAVKPQVLPEVCREIRGQVDSSKLIVSIAAGVRLEKLCQWLATERIVRVMPNTPCLIGRGASGYSPAAGASADDVQLVGRLLESVGIAIQVKEPLLDAVTGLSGSGPAYVYQIIEALSDGGVRMGLPRDAALRLAAQTVLGAAEMVLTTGEHPGVLKDRVTSPGGTTIAALEVLEQRAVRGALIEAVRAAAERSEQLSR